MKRITILILLAIIGLSANAQYTKLLDFTGTANGANPGGSLISDGTFLYGMTYFGGTDSIGVIFKIKPDGTGYSKLLDFNGTNGQYPSGSLISDGTFLYGMTYFGGTNGQGVLFKIMPDGTGYSKLLDFGGSIGGHPYGSLISDGTFIYGMTSGSGAHNYGTIFKILPDGTGYVDLLDFAGAPDGQYPYGSLISDGTFLYGMTVEGGSDSMGVIFKIKSDGTGYSKLLDFNGTNGAHPEGSLISDGTFLYGMTYYGGTDSIGVIFKIKPDGTAYTDMLDFTEDAVHGNNPIGSLFSDGTFLYGMTQFGGTSTNCSSGCGVIFKYGLATGIAENTANKGTETDFSIYPNPVSDIVTLNIDNMNNADLTLNIYNAIGELVKSEMLKHNNQQINIGDLSNGVYMVTIKSKDFTITKILIIQR